MNTVKPVSWYLAWFLFGMVAAVFGPDLVLAAGVWLVT
jgi:hypothetical protein